MLIKKRGPANVWLWSYILFNVFGTIWMLCNGELIGDVQGIVLQHVQWLVIACVVVVLSYWVLLGPVFDFFSKMPIKTLSLRATPKLVNDRIGVFLMIAQLAFFAFNLIYGVNVAGSGTAKADTSLGMVWVLLPVDSLFLIYYGAERDNKYWWANLLIYVASNVARGWLGIFLFIIFLEMCRASRRGAIQWKALIPIGFITILLYPIILNLKWVFRAAASTDFSIADGIVNFSQTMFESNYIEVISGGVMQIIARLQITSLVEEVIRYSDNLQRAFELGLFKPFWLEGLHGIVYDRVMYGENRAPIGVAFTTIGDFGGDFSIGDWNTNTGWVGWLFVTPVCIPFFLAYTALLCYLSFFLAKKISAGSLLKDLLWFSWLIYLLPGWFGSFVGFIYSLTVYLILKFVFSSIPRITLRPSGSAGAE